MNEATQLLVNNFGGLLDFDDVDTSEVQIKNPMTGDPLPVFIGLMGPEHPERKKAGFVTARKLRESMVKSGTPTFDDPADEDAQEPARIAGFVVGWRTEDGNGTLLPFSVEAATVLFTKKKWLMHQVKKALDERERFIKRSASN